MRWKLFALGLCVAQPLMAQAPPDVAPPKYEVSGSPEDGLQFVVENFPITQGPAVEAMINAEAARRCAPKTPFTGGYQVWPAELEVAGKTVPGALRYERLMLCIDPIEPREPAPADFRPSPKDESDALTAFNKYVEAFDSGEVDTVMKLRSGPAFPRKIVAQEIEEAREVFGNSPRTVYGTNWVVNPPDIDRYGIFVDILYLRPYPGGFTVCGEARMYRRSEGDYLFSRDLTRSTSSNSEGLETNPCSADPVQVSPNTAVIYRDAEPALLARLPLLDVGRQQFRILGLMAKGDRDLLEMAAKTLSAEGWECDMSPDANGTIQLTVSAKDKSLEEIQELDVRFFEQEFGHIERTPILVPADKDS